MPTLPTSLLIISSIMDRSPLGQRSESSASSDDSDYDTDMTALSLQDIDDDDDDDDDDIEATGEKCPPTRPPEYYLANEEVLDSSEVVRKEYSDATQSAIDTIEQQWVQYVPSLCLSMTVLANLISYRYITYITKELNPEQPYTFRQKHATLALKSITIGRIQNFFRWKLDQTHNLNDRRLRGTKTSSSLGTYWKQFLIVYQISCNKDMSKTIIRQMHTVSPVKRLSFCTNYDCQLLRRLVKEYGLSNDPREKCPMDVFDVTEHVQVILTTTEKMFKIGRSRIQNICFDQGGFITANRTSALLHLQYKHIVVTISRDPNGGPHRIALEWTYEFTKSFLGPKAPYVPLYRQVSC
jgi:hypothetical protein